MHILVNHLVRIPTVAQQTAFDEADREDTADALRRYAEDQTECFCDDAFDWRETETAGGWADEYPENVLFAVDDPESFTKRLVEIRNRQKETINWYLGQVMAGCETTDLAEIVEKLKEPDSSFMARRCLCGLANELDGRFTFKSEFLALWGIIPRKREWFNDFYIIYTWITHENTWAAHWRGKTPVFLCCAKWAMPTTCSYARPKQCWEGRDTSSHCACTRRDAPAGDAHTLRILRVLA